MQINYGCGSSISIGNKRYELIQFHFHCPSEHKIHGKSYDMEAHLVHKGAHGELAVIAVFMEEGKENDFIKTLWSNFPKEQGKEYAHTDLKINANQILPKNTAAYYTYHGSLTTPPCSEIVNWFVLKTPIQVSKAELEKFASIFKTALITRLTKRGPVRVRLVMSAKTLPDAPSANVIAELRGREKPDEIVLIGGHLDSWDVGQGAHDDGAGCIMVIEALRILRELGVRPRRTIRAVLFTNEENGLRGATEYAKQHANDRHFAAIETDTGGFEPKGFAARAHPDALKRLEALMTLLEPLGATKLEKADGPPGADISPLAPTGAPLLGLRMDISTYFDYHHSEADTLDKIDPRALQRSVAAMAVMAWALADEPQDLPRIEPTPASTAH